MGSSSIKEGGIGFQPFSEGLASRGLHISVSDVTKCNCCRWWSDEGCHGWKIGGGGMSAPDLIVKFTKVSLAVFFNGNTYFKPQPH